MNEDTNVVRLRFQSFEEAKANEQAILAEFQKRWDGAFEVYDDKLAKIASDSDALAKSAPEDGPALFVQISSIDIAARVVTGSAAVAAWQRLDMEKWCAIGSRDALRSMDGKVASGKLLSVSFDNARMTVTAKIVEGDEWRKIEDGVYTGFVTSSTGAYLVDAPLAPGSTFAVKADGCTELRKFARQSDWRVALQSLQHHAALIKSSHDRIRSAIAIEKSKQDAVLTLAADLVAAVKTRDEKLYGATAIAKRSLRFARANPLAFYGKP